MQIQHLVAFISCLMIAKGSPFSPMSPYERLLKNEQQQGLYSVSDKIVILTSTNFEDTVHNREVASMVEYYNSYCGACQRFAPTWKAVAGNVSKWNGVIQICAIDCASDENNDVCRNYEIMRYPTMRYFPPHYASGEKQLGINLDHLLVPQTDELIDELTRHLVNETNGGKDWPKFSPFDGENWTELFEGTDLGTKYIFVVNAHLQGLLAHHIVLDQVGVKDVSVRLLDPSTSKLLTDLAFKIGVTDKFGNFKLIKPLNDTREGFSAAIQSHLMYQKFVFVTSEAPSFVVDTDNSTDSVGVLLDRFYYDKMRSTIPTPLFRADLEQAIRNSLNHEVTQQETITGESLSALRNFVSALSRFYDYGNKNSFRKLLDFLMETSRTEVKGSEFQSFLQKLDPPIVRDGRYVGCFSTQRGLRRFPCSLWSLFHHLTIQHLESEDNEDPMEILHAMHGYIKHFFGCTECSKHFQEMARRNHIWNVTSKDQAVLWLWSAHNEVNQRLAGDVTEDVNHPKIQFPNEETCQICYKKTGDWNKSEVLTFLRNHYGSQFISDLGIDSIPRSMRLNARARQIFAGSGETHVKVGILCYVVIIICLMVAAVKFYFRRGYRKKLYTHDILGKV